MHYTIHKLLHPLFFDHKERQLIEKLRNGIRSLSPLPQHNIGLGSAELAWLNFREALRKEILNSDPRYFLHWPIIMHTMFYKGHETELAILQQSNSWPQWQTGIQETEIGYPIRCTNYPSSSGNLIHHAYFLQRFFETNDIKLNSIQTIFEFGGGYGSTARLFYQLGFRGQYTIFDFPEFLLLQEFFLHSAAQERYNPSVLHETQFISDINSIPNSLSPDLFIAAWSLSESPLEIRKKIIARLEHSKNIAIAYQNTFGEIDNVTFFKKLEEQLTQYKWTHETVGHQPNNSFLFGKYVSGEN